MPNNVPITGLSSANQREKSHATLLLGLAFIAPSFLWFRFHS